MFDRQQHEAGLGKRIISKSSYQTVSRRTITDSADMGRKIRMRLRWNGLRAASVFYATVFLLRAPRQ
jgi:hypothetical protein